MARGSEPTHLYVIVSAGAGRETASAGSGQLGKLVARLLASPRVKAVLVDPAGLSREAVFEIVAGVQNHNVAALIQDDAALARDAGADGLHVSAGPSLEQRYREARALLGPQAAIGCDASGSRHDAMTLGELGADYIAFGPGAGGSVPAAALATLAGHVAWWTVVFEIPCVAFGVDNPRHGEALVRAGADFLGVAVTLDALPEQVAGALEAYIDVLDTAADAPDAHPVAASEAS